MEYRKLTLSAVLILLAAGCLSMPSGAYAPPEAADYGEMGWVEAFDSMHEKMAEEYAFTTWRQVDWDLMLSRSQTYVEEEAIARKHHQCRLTPIIHK